VFTAEVDSEREEFDIFSRTIDFLKENFKCGGFDKHSKDLDSRNNR
jgi:hypothetical protein